MEFKEKFVAFVDILGFKQLVKSAEDNSIISLKELMSLLEELGSKEDEKYYKESLLSHK